MKYSFEVSPPPIPTSEIKEIIHTDIVVAGAGPAGLAAAVSAAESDAMVVLLEKYHQIAAPGGPGAPFINSQLQKERETNTPNIAPVGGTPPVMSGLPDMSGKGSNLSKEEIIKGLYEKSEGRADERLIKLWADKSGDVADWLIDMANDAGIFISVGRLTHMFSKGPTVQLHLSRAPVGSDNGEREAELVLLNMMAARARQRGVHIFLDTAAVRLIRSGNKGRVTGIIARKTSGDYVQFNVSKAVIMCTGDYGMDEEMLEKYCPWAKGTPKLMLDTVTGDGHKMGLWVGAAIEDAPHCPMLHFNSTNEKPVTHFRPVGPMTGGLPRGYFLYVNKRGERFLNEDQPDEFLANMVLRQEGKSFWQVFDAKSVTNENRDDIEKCIKTGAVLKGDTIEELASQFGADPRLFVATVNRYNELVKIGKDLDFGKSPGMMTLTVDQPPFYVCESPPDLLAVMGGFKRNQHGQVLDKNSHVIPGLYAAGNITSGFWGDTYPMGFLGGISRSHALVFGRLAGLSAATKEV